MIRLSVSSTSCSRCGHTPVRMQMMHRMISALPCSSNSTPVTGTRVLSGKIGTPAGLKMLTSRNRIDIAA